MNEIYTYSYKYRTKFLGIFKHKLSVSMIIDLFHEVYDPENKVILTYSRTYDHIMLKTKEYVFLDKGRLKEALEEKTVCAFFFYEESITPAIRYKRKKQINNIIKTVEMVEK